MWGAAGFDPPAPERALPTLEGSSRVVRSAEEPGFEPEAFRHRRSPATSSASRRSISVTKSPLLPPRAIPQSPFSPPP